jgi:diacylglycerol O-acyltransferase / wax synthase
MDHLSGLDAAFLHVESPEMPMHVGSLNVLQLPPGYQGDFYEDAKAHVAARMHLASIFTRKLALMPFDLSNPVWVDDEDVDLDFHVRRVTLGKPGSFRQLEQAVARQHSTLLDRSRPLWEFIIFEGLQNGQVALYTKVHHAGVDGQAGVAVGRAIFDLQAQGREIKPPRSKPRSNQYQLGMAELAGAAVRNTFHQYVKLAKTLPALGRALQDLATPEVGEDGRRSWAMPKDLRLFGPRTLFNVAITNQRTFAARSVPLAEVKAIAKAVGASLNDVVLATTAGALRRYLLDYEALPDKPLSAAVPVSLRAEGDTSANNQASIVTVNLATDLADPLERLKAIHASSCASKALMGRMKSAIPTDFPLFGAPWLISGMASMLGRSRLANVVPPASNLVVSNVAGSPVPLFFAGARMISYYPVSIPGHGMALNCTVQSYNGQMEYGLTACRRAVPDVADIGDHLVDEHARLLALTAAAPVQAAEPAPRQPAGKSLRQRPPLPAPAARQPVESGSAGRRRSGGKRA